MMDLLYSDLHLLLLVTCIVFFGLELWLRQGLYAVFYRTQRKLQQGTMQPAVSIVVITHEHTSEQQFTQCLTALTNQQYPQYEIIIVTMCPDGHITDLVTRFNNENETRIRTTAVPAETQDTLRYKLGITLGVKAAKYPYVLLTHANCTPPNEDYLAAYAKYITPQITMVLGQVYYDPDDAPTRYAIDMHRWHMQNALAARHGKPIGGDLHNMIIHRDTFINKEGFKGILNQRGYEGISLVSKLGERENTSVACCANTTVTIRYVGRQAVIRSRIEQLHALRYAKHRSPWAYYRNGFLMGIQYCYLLSTLCYIAWRIAMSLYQGVYHLPMVQFDFIVFVTIGLQPYLHQRYFNQSMQALGAPLRSWSLFLYEYCLPLRALYYRFK